jgi:PAS domain S-box-containing protein
VETARDFILTISSQGIVTSFNPEFFVATGWTADECIGQSYERRIQAGDLPKAQELFGRVLRGEVLPLFELRLNRRDGSPMPTEFTFTTRVENGQVVELLGIGRDITERKRVQAAHDRLAMAVEQSAETVVITDTKGTILYANPAFEKTSGYTRAEALGQNPRVLKSGKQDADFYARMWQTLRCGEIWHGHFINRRKDGTLYEEEATISPVRDAGGKVINFVAVKRDVTHEVQLETQFRQAQKMEAIGQLAGGVAHDFNNILAVIQMRSDLLKSEGGLSNEQADSVDEIGVTVQRAVALTRQLLLFSRREVFQPRDLDLNETIANTTKMLKRMLGETIEMQLKLAAQPLFLHADASMLDQVLMNLCVNARDAMPGGGRLVIETSGVELDEMAVAQSVHARPGSFVCLSVSDSGGGIPSEILPQIFEPFFTTKPVGKGTGLGLATVFGIVQQHQGWINVYSEVGHGTTFRIYLPRLTGNVVVKSAPPAFAAMRGGNETILLAEDDPDLRVAVRKALSQLGYRILEAPTGVKALEVWQENRNEISLLLTDLVMPDGMTGKDLALRLLQENPKLKVIYMSGYSAEVVGRDFPFTEDVNFLTKPFPAQKLAQTIRDRLDAST